ncbi:prolyl oligopeptidase family serine peptidase [Streptosporangium sp. NPDC020072]|uniref:alpha/beta hydrolase n=1 Tax=Streptosporangium sp. NPDC020072 TaxID=3154788 RepID=UPI0034259D80
MPRLRSVPLPCPRIEEDPADRAVLDDPALRLGGLLQRVPPQRHLRSPTGRSRTPQQYPDRYREVSPTSDIRAGLPRTLLVVGDRDRSARPETVTGFGDALRKKGVHVEAEELPFAEHAFDNAYGSLTSQTGRRILLDFLIKDTR